MLIMMGLMGPSMAMRSDDSPTEWPVAVRGFEKDMPA